MDPATKTPNERLKYVEQALGRLARRMTKLESASVSSPAKNTESPAAFLPSPKSAWKTPPVIVGSLSVFATFCTLAYNIHKVDTLSGKTDDVARSINGPEGLTAREVRLEVGLRMVTQAAAPQLLHELDQTLSESAKAAQTGQLGAAAAILQQASERANVLRQQGVAAPQGFFLSAASTLSKIASKHPQLVQSVWISLASYRSAVIRPGNLAVIFAPKSNRSLTSEDLTRLAGDGAATEINGFGIYRITQTLRMPANEILAAPNQASIILNSGNADAFRPGFRNGDGVRGISGIVLVTRNQTLDPFVWTDVVFVGTRIRYLGGPVTLRNVQFINCTFDVADAGQPILNFVMMQDLELRLPGLGTNAVKGP